MTTINWEKDSLDIIRAKQELEKFLQEKKELSHLNDARINNYHDMRIKELTVIIKS